MIRPRVARERKPEVRARDFLPIHADPRPQDRMPVLKISLTAASFPSSSWAKVAVRPLRFAEDHDDVHRLVAALGRQHQQNSRGSSPVPSMAGLMAEVRSRPGRQVWAWLARPEMAGAAPTGLVILVQAGATAPHRWSIAWLLVDPACRRRGIGMVLVATAVRFAGDRGATEVYAETLDRWPAAVAFWQAARLAAERHAATLPPSGESRKTAEG